MGERRRVGRAVRPSMRSPGRPPVARREHRQGFWEAIASACRARTPLWPRARTIAQSARSSHACTRCQAAQDRDLCPPALGHRRAKRGSTCQTLAQPAAPGRRDDGYMTEDLPPRTTDILGQGKTSRVRRSTDRGNEWINVRHIRRAETSSIDPMRAGPPSQLSPVAGRSG